MSTRWLSTLTVRSKGCQTKRGRAFHRPIDLDSNAGPSPIPCEIQLSLDTEFHRGWAMDLHCCLSLRGDEMPYPFWNLEPSPTHTYPDHQSFFICFLHLLQSTTSSLFNLRSWRSLSRTSAQVFFGLPLSLAPFTSNCISFLWCIPLCSHSAAMTGISYRMSDDVKRRLMKLALYQEVVHFQMSTAYNDVRWFTKPALYSSTTYLPVQTADNDVTAVHKICTAYRLDMLHFQLLSAADEWKTVYKTCTTSSIDTLVSENCRQQWCHSSWQNLHCILTRCIFNCCLQSVMWKMVYETCTVSRHDTFSTVYCGWPANVYQSSSVLRQAQLHQ